MKLFAYLVIGLLPFFTVAQNSIHQFKVVDIEGNEFDFSELKGKKIMVVNTASECGLTPQYKQLEEVYKEHSDKLVIVGFPSNDFGSQEPGSNADIVSFCEKNYGVTFPMMSKVVVKGEEQCDLYNFLTKKELNGLEDSKVQWNFQKYLLDENGKLVKVLSPRVLPNDPEILTWIKGSN